MMYTTGEGLKQNVIKSYNTNYIKTSYILPYHSCTITAPLLYKCPSFNLNPLYNGLSDKISQVTDKFGLTSYRTTSLGSTYSNSSYATYTMSFITLHYAADLQALTTEYLPIPAVLRSEVTKTEIDNLFGTTFLEQLITFTRTKYQVDGHDAYQATMYSNTTRSTKTTKTSSRSYNGSNEATTYFPEVYVKYSDPRQILSFVSPQEVIAYTFTNF